MADLKLRATASHKPAQDLVGGVALLLGVDHVRLGKDRAAPGDARRATGAARRRPDLLNAVKKTRGLLVNERSGAGGAIAAGLSNP